MNPISNIYWTEGFEGIESVFTRLDIGVEGKMAYNINIMSSCVLNCALSAFI